MPACEDQDCHRRIDGHNRDARRTIFVHIGTHKTGSTSIQHFLTHNAAALGREGILVPAAGRHLFGHHHLAWELRKDVRLAGATGHVSRLIEELRDASCDKAIISSEDFEYLVRYPAELRRFVRLLRDVSFEPVFVVFFRERAGYLESLAAALRNHGVTHEIEWYREQLRKDDAILVRDDWWFDFDRDRFSSTWTEITSAELRAFDYDACVARDALLPTILETIEGSRELIDSSRHWPRSNLRRPPN